jgi:hypothetical protein
VVKPTVQIRDAFLQRSIVWSDSKMKQAYVLIGTVLDYPESHMGFPGCVENNKPAQTGEVVKCEGNVVETKRTRYVVQNWLTQPDFQTTLADTFSKEGLTQQ